MIEKILATPYNGVESLKWLARYIFGVSNKNARLVKEISSPCIFDDKSDRRYVLIAVGDIMGMHGHRLELDDAVKKFIRGSDYFLGNLEGVISDKNPDPWPISFYERHEPAILEDLSKIFPPAKTYLCVSNNHACDLGNEEFFKSMRTVKSGGFNVFGSYDTPFIDVNESLRVISGTMWLNRKSSRVSSLESAEFSIKKGSFNLLYPHAGYEFERYPRPEIIRYARREILTFDAIVGHHTHSPQSVTAEEVNSGRRLLAYSLGTFCCATIKKIWRSGIIIKMEFGPDAGGKWIIRKAEWRNTECVKTGSDHYIVKAVKNPCLDVRRDI